MHEVVGQGFKVPAPRVRANVRVPAGVLQGSIVGSSLVRFMSLVKAVTISENEQLITFLHNKLYFHFF